MRERSEMSISDLIRATALASAMTAGTLTVSLIALPLLTCSAVRLTYGTSVQPWQHSPGRLNGLMTGNDAL